MTDQVLHDDVERDDVGEPTTGRRGLLGKAAVVAAVAAVTGAGSRRAQAANGDTAIVGGSNNATATTRLSGGSTLKVDNGGTAGVTGGYVASIYATQSVSERAAIIGEASSGSYGWGVYGRNVNGSQGRGVFGQNGGSSGQGVYGLNTGSIGIGVYGEHKAAGTESGTGVLGKSNTGVGVIGNGATVDISAVGTGKFLLTAPGFANPPTGASTAGTLGRDAAGNLWYSPASGVYRKLAGTGTAGAFHALTPARLYDSRAAAPSIGQLAGGGTRTLSMADKRDLNTGNPVTANYVPAGATAIACNVTVVNTAGSGFLTINPGGVTEINAATINWSGAGQILNNGVIVTLNASREVTVICGGTAASTDFVIDVTGYFL